MGRGDRALRAYVRALDMSGLVLTAPAFGRPVQLRIARDPAVALREGTRKPHSIIKVFWCAGAAQAEMVLAVAAEALGGISARGVVDADAATVINAITRAADALGAVLRMHAEVETAALQAIREVDRKMEALKRSGELRPVNRDYQNYRLAKAAAGEKFLPYVWWIENYRIKILKAVAASARTLERLGAQNAADETL